MITNMATTATMGTIIHIGRITKTITPTITTTGINTITIILTVIATIMGTSTKPDSTTPLTPPSSTGVRPWRVFAAR
jgi:hypothetical protein